MSVKQSESERGNVFFTLFGAVAILGVLGAGIVATMRGPLTTMVEVNRQEQAKAELRNNASFILLAADDATCEGGPGNEDGYTEGPQPNAAIANRPTGGGGIPASIAAVKNDPWGTPYGYCAWDHGPGGSNGGCGNILAGGTSTNNLAIVVISAGPDRVFQTDCSADPGYLNDIEGAGDDLVNPITYTGAIAGSDGLWQVVDATTAGIERDIQVGGDIVIDPANTGSGQLQLGARSMLLPTDDELGPCNMGNNLLPRVNDNGAIPIIEICDGDSNTWFPAGSLWSINAEGEVFYNLDFVGIGNNNPTVPLEVTGNTILDGEALVTNKLTLNADIEMKDGQSIIWSTGDASITGNNAVLEMTNAAGSTLSMKNNDIEIQADTTIVGKSAAAGSALTVQNSTPSPILVVQNDGNVAVGAGSADDRLQVAGVVDVSDGYKIDDLLILDAEGASVLLGYNTGTSVEGDDNTIIGSGAGNALKTGQANTLIGVGVDVPNAATEDYLNIVNVIHGSRATKQIGIGYADQFDVAGLSHTLSVNGSFYVNTTSEFDGNMTVDGNIIATDGVVDIDDALTTTGDITGPDFYATSEIFVDGDLFGPPAECADDEKLSWEDGAGWSCINDLGGGSGSGGSQDLSDVLGEGNDADAQDAVNFDQVGANQFCNADLTACFDPATQGGIFEVDDADTPTLVRQRDSAAPYASVDFVFGSPSLDNIAGADDNTRMFFDKSKGAFRAGTEDSNRWDSGSVGNNSVAFGYRNTASGAYSVALGGVFNRATNSFAVAMGNGSEATGLNSTAIGFGTVASGPGSMAIGLDEDGAAFPSPRPTVSGAGSLGIFFGDQQDGVELSAVKTMGLFGGRLVIDPAEPATALSASAHEDAGTLAVDVEGYVGAIKYCDKDGNDCFESADIAGGNLGIWQPDGTNNYIEYDDALGGVRIGKVTGQPEPETDWNFNVASSTVFTTANTVAIGGSATATGGDSDLVLDVTGAIGADEYCDSNGDDCFTVSEVGQSVFEVTGGAGTELVRQNAAMAPIATSDFVFGSTQIDDIAGSDDNARMFFDKSKGAFRAGSDNSGEWDSAFVGTASVAFGASNRAGDYATALNFGNRATGSGSMAWGQSNIASGAVSTAFGRFATAGSGTAGDGSGDYSIAVGLQSNVVLNYPKITGDRSMVLFFDKNTANANNNYTFSGSDKFALIGGEFQIDDVSSSANKGCIRYNSATTKLQFSHDCSAYSDMAAGATTVFEVTGAAGSEVVRQVAGSAPIATADFIFGATSMTNQAGADDDARMYFDKSKGAVRAGIQGSTYWDADSANVGNHSAAFGRHTMASGEGSFSVGYNTLAGNQLRASGNGSFAGGYKQGSGYEIVASGNGSLAFGAGAGGGLTASNSGAVAMGHAADTNIESTGRGSFAFGFAIGYDTGSTIISSGDGSMAWGVGEDYIPVATPYINSLLASGKGSTAFGTAVTASAPFSVAAGLGQIATSDTREVSGANSFVVFMDDPGAGGYDFSETSKFALIGGEFQIDDVSSSANKGCIRYNSDDTKLEFSHDCSTYAEFGDASGSAVFEVTGAAGSEVVRQVDASAPYATSDFVVGAATLDHGGANNNRMFFDKSKAAFRAGQVTGNNWNDANRGANSAAFGKDTIALGSHSMAWNDITRATGTGSTAWGGNTAAEGSYSTAFGGEAVASATRSVAIGLGDSSGTALIEHPQITNTGIGSIAFFMRDQKNVDVSAPNTMAILGGTIIVDPASPATQTAASEHEDSDGDDYLALDVEGYVGAIKYCDEAGDNCFAATDVGGGSSIFEVTGAAGSELVRQVAGSAPIATADFIFGATSMTNQAGADDDARMYFDKSKGAFRAGAANSTQWDDGNVGDYSTVFGNDNRANGSRSASWGSANVSSAGWTTSFGNGNTASQAYSTAFGNSTVASGSHSTAFGYDTNATGEGSTAWGGDKTGTIAGGTAGGLASTAFGLLTDATGTASLAFGREVIAGADYAVAIGLGDNTGVGATRPKVTGANSFGIFMGDQVSVDVNVANVAAFLGTSMIINPDTTSASPAVPATGFTLDVVGRMSLLTDATENIFIEGGNTTATGTHNIVIGTGTGGFTAGSLLAAGYSNIFLGTAAGGSSTSAYQNVAIGYQANRLNQSGRNSVYIGYRAGNNVRSTEVNTQNVAIGANALNGVAGSTTGARNTAIGFSAGSLIEAGSDNILIGASVQLADPDDNETLNIGDIVFGDLGDTSGDPRIGAHKYCDETLTTCFTAADVGGGVFEVTGAAGSELVRQVAGSAPIATSDFLFGGTALANQAGADDDKRMFFDKSTGAFRAGGTPDTQWDTPGDYSTAFGEGAVASGAGSMAWGTGAPGGITEYSSAIGTGATAFGAGTTASGDYATAFGGGKNTNTGSNPVASGHHSTAFGGSVIASGDFSTAWGGWSDIGPVEASGVSSTAFGMTAVTASGDASVAFGESVTAGPGANTIAMGYEAQATGARSIAIGLGDASTDTFPVVSGTGSLGIFMGDQESVDLSANNTMAIMGGNLGLGTVTPTNAKLHIYDESSPFVTIEGGESSVSVLSLMTKGDGESTFSSANTNAWSFFGFGDDFIGGLANDLWLVQYIGGAIKYVMNFDADTGNISLGSNATGAGKLDVYNTADQPSVIVRAHTTQTSNVMEVKNSSASNILTLANGGTLNLAGPAFEIDDNTASANKGCVRYRSASTKLQYSHDCSIGSPVYAEMGTTPLSGILAATAANTIDNLNYSQTWQWNTAGNYNAFAFSTSGIAKGSLVTMTNSNSAAGANGSVLALNVSSNTSAIVPLLINNYATGNSLTINDSLGDITPFVIDANGRVGISNGSPSVALDVNGDIEFTGVITDVSDLRLKKDIKPLDERGSMLEKIAQIETYSFVMKDDEKGRTEFGVIAQELDTLFPELVSTADDDMNTLSVNYVGLIAPMIKATQELKAENDTLKAQLAAMNDQQASLQGAVEKLSGQVDILNRMSGQNLRQASFFNWPMLMLALVIFCSGGAYAMGRRAYKSRSAGR